jgi:hypothetical protein
MNGNIEKAIDIYSRKGAKPAKENNVTILFQTAKDTFHLCVLCAFARKKFYKPLIPGSFTPCEI